VSTLSLSNYATWLEAAWHITTAKNGMSAKTIEQTLGVSYNTAWTIQYQFMIIIN